MYDGLRRIVPRLSDLAACRSTRELEAHPVYRDIEPELRRALDTVHRGDFSRGEAPPRDRYRALAWNIERGARFNDQVAAFRAHEYLRDCDLLLLTETDVGMARSGNRDVARELARELAMYYAFAPCYLSLVKGSGVERQVEGDNDLGLDGNAILSRYPIAAARLVRLANGIDKMAAREQRIGSQAALVATIGFPGWPVTAACVHLDAQSTQRHRSLQMRDVLDALPAGPAVVGGDWNTTTFDSSTAFRAIMGYWRRVLMGADNVIRNHYLHPYRRFERELFELLESRAFDWRGANVLGEHTIYYDFANERTFHGLAEWVPLWCFPFIRWALRNHGGGCPLKLDWFAVRGLRPVAPAVIHDVREGRYEPLSDHDAIGLEIAPI
jgi:endonuclease/exonuclease/phosphatase family metal-dependent hydrolase